MHASLYAYLKERNYVEFTKSVITHDWTTFFVDFYVASSQRTHTHERGEITVVTSVSLRTWPRTSALDRQFN